jgi:iron(III) transport system substrate-binding protein
MLKLTNVFLVFALTTALIHPVGDSKAANAPALVVYTALSQADQDYLQQAWMENEENRPLQFRSGSDLEIYNTFLAEVVESRGDVFVGLSAVLLDSLAEMKLLMPLTFKNHDIINRDFLDNHGRGDVYWGAMSGYIAVAAFNPMAGIMWGVEAPASLEQLLSSGYKRRLIMPNPALSGIGFIICAGIVHKYGRERGWEFIRQLRDQCSVFTPNGSIPARYAGWGAGAVGLTNYHSASSAIANGAPLSIVFPDGLSVGNLDACAIVAKVSPNPLAAAFVDWVFSKKRLESLGRQYPYTALKPEAGSYRRVFKGIPKDYSPYFVTWEFVDKNADQLDAFISQLKREFAGVPCKDGFWPSYARESCDNVSLCLK